MRDERLSLLIISPDKGTCTELLNIIGESDYRLDETDNEKSAFDRIMTVTPDIIVIDVDQSRFDGLELFKRIRGYDASQNIPVLFCGSQLRVEAIPTAVRSAGACDFLALPFKAGEALIRVENMARICRLQKEATQAENIREFQELSRATFHALNQPLMAISGQAQLLAMKISDEALKKRCQTIIDAVDEISDKIKQLRTNRKSLLGS